MNTLKVLPVKSDDLVSIVNEVFDKGNHATIRVTGNSMFPFLRNERDYVELARTDYSELKVGDVVLVKRDVRCFHDDDGCFTGIREKDTESKNAPVKPVVNVSGRYVMHRIVKKRSNYFYMASDRSRNVEGPFSPDQVLAVVVGVWRDGKRIDCHSSLAWKFLSMLWVGLLPFRPYIFKFYRHAQKRLG